jgi:hypothetical protein
MSQAADALRLLLAAGGVALAAAAVASTLRLRSVVSFSLAVYVIASAIVVLLVEGLSVGQHADTRAFAVGVAACLVGAVLVWDVRGRPWPPLPAFSLRDSARRHPVVAALAALVVLALAYKLFLVFAIPPNNGDALSYHLTRAAEWLQHGGIHHIVGPGRTAENDYPPNAEIQILFTFAFSGGDAASALPQFLAQGVVMLAVYGIARRLGWEPAAALFAALLAPTTAQVALQSVTTQNDLVTAALLGTAAYFLHARERPDVWLAGLAVGLALGTKLTAIFALPVLALIALAALRGRALAAAAAAAVAGFALVGSAQYVRNVVESGRVLGTLSGEPGLQQPEITMAGTISSAARNAYGLLDFAGYPLDHEDLRVPTALARACFTALGIPQNPPESTGYPFGFAFNLRANEDIAFFGPLGFLLLLPLSVVVLVLWGLRHLAATHAAHAAALPLYVVLLALAYRYSGQGRFLLTPVVLTLPLAAALYGRRFLVGVTATVGAVSLALVLAHNETKPTGLRGTTPAWELSRSEAQGLHAPIALSYLSERIEAEVPPDARLGVRIGEHDADYVLYGPELRRRLEPLATSDVLAEAERRGLRWVFLGRFTPPPPPTARWKAEQLSDAGILLSRL